jgi:hypothetical protein
MTRAAAQVHQVWTPEETAECLRVPLQTLYYWRRVRSGPPAHRVGKHLRYVPDEVMAWLREQA